MWVQKNTKERVLTFFGSMKLDHEFVKAPQNRYIVVAFDSETENILTSVNVVGQEIINTNY